MCNIKEYHKEWDEYEIEDYLVDFNVLVLFDLDLIDQVARIVIHGNLNDDKKIELSDEIVAVFGKANTSNELFSKINDFAEKWYNRVILKKKARVINCKKKI